MFYSTGNQDSDCGKQDYKYTYTGFPDAQMVKRSTCSAEDLGSIPASGRSPGEGNGYPLQYSCLEIPQTEEPGGLQPMVLQGCQELAITEGLTHTHTHIHTCAHIHTHTYTHVRESNTQLDSNKLQTTEKTRCPHLHSNQSL